MFERVTERFERGSRKKFSAIVLTILGLSLIFTADYIFSLKPLFENLKFVSWKNIYAVVIFFIAYWIWNNRV